MHANAKQLKEIVRRIVEVAHPLRIILFGSAARGEMTKDSDIDLMVVMPNGTHRRHTAMDLYSLMKGIKSPVDFVVATPEVLERHKDTIGYIYKTVLREGKTIYSDGEERLEDIADQAVIASRRIEPSRSFREFLASRRRAGLRLGKSGKYEGENTMLKKATISARIEPGLKGEVEDIFRKIGLSSAQAINLFFRQVKLRRGMPFSLEIPNRKTRKVFADTDAGRNLVRCKDADDMFAKLGN